MRHFIGYHNRHKRGFPANSRDPLSIHAKEPLDRLHEQTVWVVEGVGNRSPKKFILCAYFVVNEIGPSDLEDFKHAARGEEGQVFGSPPILNDFEWFDELKIHVCAYFQRSVPELTDKKIIDEFTRLANLAD